MTAPRRHKQEPVTARPIPAKAGDMTRTDVVGGNDVQIAHHQGWRPYQEDRFMVAANVDTEGGNGRQFLSRLFSAAAKATNSAKAGSTATALLLDKDMTLNVAYLGDSPLVMIIHDTKTGEVTATKLTRDHHAALPAEKKRVEKAGGFVAGNGRAGGRLMLSRAFGDAEIAGVSRQPEFARAKLKKHMDAGRNIYLCLSSDGLLETLNARDLIEPFKAALAAGNEAGLAAAFATYAYSANSLDNITALVVKLPPAPAENLLLALADGHGGHATADKVVAAFKSLLSPK
ncbi:MAG: PP2C family protein-serine/threonine phosphatase [Micavibrio sp.]|nr:PP2C family protein-serine/threonine phosphatase [Micavibrio sp.]